MGGVVNLVQLEDAQEYRSFLIQTQSIMSMVLIYHLIQQCQVILGDTPVNKRKDRQRALMDMVVCNPLMQKLIAIGVRDVLGLQDPTMILDILDQIRLLSIIISLVKSYNTIIL